MGRKEQIWTTKHKRRKIHEQKHRLAGEEEEGRRPPRRSPPTEGAAPPGRRSTPGERRRTPRNATDAPATELTSTTVPQREWSVDRRRRAERGRRGVNIGHGFRRGRERAEVSLFPREPARAARSRQNRQRERRKSMAEEKRKPRAYGQSQERRDFARRRRGSQSGPSKSNTRFARHGLGLPFWPISNTPSSPAAGPDDGSIHHLRRGKLKQLYSCSVGSWNWRPGSCTRTSRPHPPS